MIVQTREGYWVVNGDTHFARWVADSGRLDHDQTVLVILKSYVKPGMIAIDVGAGIGTHACAYLKWGAFVHAFEPHPEQFDCLCRNCPGAVCVNAAVGAKSEPGYLEARIEGNIGSSYMSKSGIPVAIIALDSYAMAGEVGFIKIDAEGSEVAILEGARRLIDRWRPALWMEVFPGALARAGYSASALERIIGELGYGPRFFHPPGSDWNSCRGDQCDVLCVPVSNL